MRHGCPGQRGCWSGGAGKSRGCQDRWRQADIARRAYDEGGELSGIVEFRRHFPLITDNAKAGECVRIIAGWKPVLERKARASVGSSGITNRRRPTA
jgi:hypothetical protein